MFRPWFHVFRRPLLPLLSATPPFAAALAILLVTTPAARGQEGDGDWQIMAGVGSIYHPDYLGSDDLELQAVPFFSIDYRDRVFLRGPELGVNVVRPGNGFEAGAMLRYSFLISREEDDNDALRGLGDLDGAIEAGVFAEYELGRWSAGLELFRDVSDEHDGSTAELGVGYAVPLGTRAVLEIEASTAWVDDDYMQAYFGISPAQSVASGLPDYTAEAGFRSAGLTLGLNYRLTDRWLLANRLAYDRLLGDAADSPIVTDDGSRNQTRLMLFLGYRF